MDLRIRGVLERKRWLSSCVHLLSGKTIIKLCLKRFDHMMVLSLFFYFHSADDVGMEPGYIAAIVLCVVLAIGIIALIIVLYAYNQR